uniref:Transposase n=1 Tax=Plectus sambesii TaxID=2011161 RepID=A0A914VY40_9BILA
MLSYFFEFQQRNFDIARKAGSGRPKSGRTDANIAQVRRRIKSPVRRPGTHQSQRKIAAETGIGRSTVQRIVSKDLNLTSFRKVGVHQISAVNVRRRVVRCRGLLQRIRNRGERRIVFTDEKMFTLRAPRNAQNERVYGDGRKRTIARERLVVPRAHFSRKLMVSGGISWNGKTRLHLIPENERINADSYQYLLTDGLLPDCQQLYPAGNFIFQQDSARPHVALTSLALLEIDAPGYIGPEEWPACSPDLNACDYRLWAYLAQRVYSNGGFTTVQDLEARLHQEWDAIPLHLIRSWIGEFRPRCQATIRLRGQNIQHLFNKL